MTKEQDRALAEMIRNMSVETTKVAKDVQSVVEATQKKIEAAKQIRPDPETLKQVAESSAKARQIAADATAMVERMNRRNIAEM